MGHISKNYSRCTIDVDSGTGIVFVRQRWRYSWIQGYRASPWTAAQQKMAHARFEAAILRQWNNRAWLKVTGDSPYARQFAGRELSLRFDIKEVTSNPHWNVSVKKIRPGDFDVSGVDWKKREAYFDSEDSYLEEKTTLEGRHLGFQTGAAHEFGHMLGNDDEYPNDRPASPHVKDVDSILHGGNQLRARHFTNIVNELNRLVPDTRFAISRVR